MIWLTCRKNQSPCSMVTEWFHLHMPSYISQNVLETLSCLQRAGGKIRQGKPGEKLELKLHLVAGSREDELRPSSLLSWDRCLFSSIVLEPAALPQAFVNGFRGLVSKSGSKTTQASFDFSSPWYQLRLLSSYHKSCGKSSTCLRTYYKDYIIC